MVREKQTIARIVRRLIEADRPQVNVDKNPDRPPVRVTLAVFETQIAFYKPCKAATVTVDYEWQVSGNPAVAPAATRKRRALGCLKVFGGWICS